ncbi:disulfide bond formation protein DsbA [Cereibacter changlensis JA139]|uniref:Disulfide bond formation protein DsbA n=1 Tax=Cereibacter changlensis JA139 TaxID=1188249 RepID=A0A2T4JNC1_9RHOB|nr:disulfide bond formation protein DsbA [Cereibacter changlensis JA139]
MRGRKSVLSDNKYRDENSFSHRCNKTPLPAARTAIAALALAAAFSTPGSAGEPAYTPEFGASVRAYLLDNPEVVLEVFRLLEGQERAKKTQAASASIAKVADQLFQSDDARKGRADAPVIAVEFFDYQCGYCKAALPELAQAMEGRDDVAVVLKEFPILGPASKRASRIALAVRALHGDDAYLGFHNALLLQKGELNDATLSMLAEAAGFDFDALSVRSNEADISATIAANWRLAQTLSINGTPAFVFEDELVGGMMNAERLTQKFDLLAKAEKPNL